MLVFYSDVYVLPLPAKHKFPITKYCRVRDGLVQEGIVYPHELYVSQPVETAIICLAHTHDYVEQIMHGTVHPIIMRRIGFPWTPELALRSLTIVGGAIASAEEALESGIAGNLAGGTHHAFCDAGEGFCVFNDLAVTALYLLTQRLARRIAIVDLDVHQGNGTAAILGGRNDTYLLSIHAAKNYPHRKVRSTVDIDLPDNTEDAEYLAIVERELMRVVAWKPDIILYQAGVDPLREDTLGRLALSMQGLAQRDALVFRTCKRHGIPVSIAMGGGYAQPIDATVEAHIQTYRVLREVYG
ncbi:MAG: histone deacetylase [Bacteroidota bacterium]|nr:histone deacetylase [Candidatus Kapabacteria bacterium]MDW8220905.1 histone deacetylase [Bacteroidota bacterium]